MCSVRKISSKPSMNWLPRSRTSALAPASWSLWLRKRLRAAWIGENLHLATLARFIEATGGRLRITAVYDDEVEIGIGDLTDAVTGPE